VKRFTYSIPSEKRDDMARLAHAFASQLNDKDARAAIAGMYGISNPEAGRLIGRGRILARQSAEVKA
jgi:hypothetical protein